MSKVIAIANQKGGVGKTTTVINIGFNLAASGKKVLLIDNDPQANFTKTLLGEVKDQPESVISSSATGGRIPGISNTHELYLGGVAAEPIVISENLHLFAASDHLSNIETMSFDAVMEFRLKVTQLGESYDFILIDCLPSFTLLQTAAHVAADFLLIPTELEDYSKDGVQKQIEKAVKIKNMYNPKLSVIGVFANKCSNPLTRLQDEYLGHIYDLVGDQLFENNINRATRIGEAIAARKPVSVYAPNSVSDVQFKQVTDELLKRIEGAA